MGWARAFFRFARQIWEVVGLLGYQSTFVSWAVGLFVVLIAWLNSAPAWGLIMMFLATLMMAIWALVGVQLLKLSRSVQKDGGFAWTFARSRVCYVPLLQAAEIAHRHTQAVERVLARGKVDDLDPISLEISYILQFAAQDKIEIRACRLPDRRLEAVYLTPDDLNRMSADYSTIYVGERNGPSRFIDLCLSWFNIWRYIRLMERQLAVLGQERRSAEDKRARRYRR